MGETTFKIALILSFIILIILIGAIILFIREYGAKKRAHQRELETKDILHNKELLATQLEIQKATMSQIGREIHDNVGQKLTLSSLYLQQLSLEDKDFQHDGKLHEINDIITQSLSELRKLSKSLTDDTIITYTITELIQQECDRIKSLKQQDIRFKSTTNAEHISYEVKSVLYRVIQEFMQNSLKHSECTEISIHLDTKNDCLFLELRDNGKGFDIDKVKSQGIGLKNITKRIEMIHGTHLLKSSKTEGTCLIVSIPEL